MIRATRIFTPPTDVIEVDDKLVILVEVAGMRSSDLNIKLTERHLTIAGTREKPRHANPAYHQIEIGFGSFRIDIDLPWTVERDSVSATYEAGFLEIELPRKAPKIVRVVDVANNEQD
jgi:HSP20 family protein